MKIICTGCKKEFIDSLCVSFIRQYCDRCSEIRRLKFEEEDRKELKKLGDSDGKV